MFVDLEEETAEIETLEILGGNTNSPPISSSKKQVSQLMHWCFTWNNYEKDDIETLETLFKHLCHKYCFQEETGKCGTPHLQGVISMKKKARWTEFGLPNVIHWEKTRNLTKSYKYCSKIETRTGDVFTLNYELPYVVNIPKMYKWQSDILNILDDLCPPDERKIYWFWELQGCRGKTTIQKYIYTHYAGVVVLSGKGSDMKNGVVNYLKNNGTLPKIVLINIPRSIDQDFVSYSGIEEVKDMFFFSGKYEGGMVCGAPPHVFIFANEPPATAKMSPDRWIITNI